MRAVSPVSLDAIRAAARRIAGDVVRTPLVRLPADGTPADVWLKLETLQPIGSFKIRGATNAIAQIPRDELSRGVWTASAGNMAQGVAWCARKLGVPCRVVVPDGAPRAKLMAIERLGARPMAVPFDVWWAVMTGAHDPRIEGRFVHPVCDEQVIAGHGTIGLEIVEDLPDVDVVLVPFGGGGLSCGIAAAVRALRPATRVVACEVATAAPFSASLVAGAPVSIDWRPSFIDGIGGRSLLEPMWPLVRDLLGGSIVVTVDDVAGAVRQLVTSARVVAEGAGATPVAAALSGRAGTGRIACVVSGGNIDASVLARILDGGTP
jgi:threonine dehydratase